MAATDGEGKGHDDFSGDRLGEEPGTFHNAAGALYGYACAVWPSPFIGRHVLPRAYAHDRDSSWRLDARRVVSRLTVENRIAVRRHRGGG